MRHFPPEIEERLRCYVYRLIDPRNGETFYVGMGRSNRVFQHAYDELGGNGDELLDRLRRIRQIRSAGLEVAHVIHRHGLDEKTAREIEAALIDAYPGLTNIQSGQGSDDRGCMHVDEILKRFQAETAKFRHRLLLINVYKTALERSLYDATRYAWKIDPKRAQRAEYVLAVVQGLIVGAFVVREWRPATPDNFPSFEAANGRWGFVGEPAPNEIQMMYRSKRVPDEFRKPGAANPIKYTFQ